MKKLHNLIVAKAKVMAEGCDECGGSGMQCAHPECCMPQHREQNCIMCPERTGLPCPSCSEVRKLIKSWQNCKSIDDCDCGATSNNPCPDFNPTYTIPSTKAALIVLGLWGEFKGWLWLLEIDTNQPIEYWPVKHADKYEILTTPELFKAAVISFMEQSA